MDLSVALEARRGLELRHHRRARLVRARRRRLHTCERVGGSPHRASRALNSTTDQLAAARRAAGEAYRVRAFHTGIDRASPPSFRSAPRALAIVAAASLCARSTSVPAPVTALIALVALADLAANLIRPLARVLHPRGRPVIPR